MLHLRLSHNFIYICLFFRIHRFGNLLNLESIHSKTIEIEKSSIGPRRSFGLINYDESRREGLLNWNKKLYRVG